MLDLVARSSEVANGNQLNLPLPSVLEKLHWLLSLVFSLSFLGFCRNMAVQHGRHHRSGPAPSVDIKDP